ncbi:NAD(P)-dependent oxidoreductase [Streptomyces sp. Wb2n-11]|uniref:NAD-dependent epimerase/dehydratase family protein n=1 Tax=Streptomyces sp. Wb2n-11 TaxID=1030533 RepID=UPI000A73E6E8|nr:NAD-dependent epimerase/dehydratase family protein [Streptomyces sp. Wb2n-11]
MRVLVTGATGFIGRRLARRLVARDHEVTAIVRSTSCLGVLPRKVRLVQGDLADGKGLAEAARDAECVLHLAGVVKAPRAEGFDRVNATGTRRLGEHLAALSSPPRMILCSSLAAAGPSAPGRPRREEDPPAPVSRYGRSKLAGEQALRELAPDLGTVVIRPPIVYGPGDPAFVPALAAMVRAGVAPRPGRGTCRYSLVHVDDVCAALEAVMERGGTLSRDDPAAGVYTVSDGVEHSWGGLCAAVARAMGRRPPLVVPVPAPAVHGVAWLLETAARLRGPGAFPAANRDKAVEGRCPGWTCSTDKAARELGFTSAVRLEAGLAAMFDDGGRGRAGC